MNDPIPELQGHLGWCERSAIEPTVDPEWDRIDLNVFSHHPDDDVDGEHKEMAVAMFTRMMAWVFQDGMNDKQGLMIRAAVASWVVVPLLQPLTLTQLALGLGLKKQSLGRWVDRFKIDFPNIRNKHMR